MERGKKTPVVTACHSCGLIAEIDRLDKRKISCRRCGTTIKKAEKHAALYTLVFSISAFMLFIPALHYPVLDISVNTLSSSATILSSIHALYSEGLGSVGVLVLITSVITPMSFLFLSFYISASAYFGKRFPFFTTALRLSNFMKSWHMADVFLIGILVSVVKLIDMASLDFGFGIYLFMLICVFTAVTEVYYDSFQFRLKVIKDD